jgi:uncharacterized membrane protein YhaH (DUF805 family)
VPARQAPRIPEKEHAAQSTTSDQPTPIQWYLSPWKRYVLFEGRSGRPESWWFYLGHFVVALVLVVLAPAFPGLARAGFFFHWLAALLPSISVAARRLHDTGQPGWLQLIALIPFGGIVLLILCAQPSKPGANQYGEAPLPPAP